ncbi:MAG: NUDIX domain-containing protein, partial [Candidatus Yanofskybacteria bacterium]|nr:NUDIX domain-containing protein [Candidatus Yanofskybacteria bacterium]
MAPKNNKVDPKKLFKVIITAIVNKGGKYLVLQRAEWEKKFPLRWTVPGGKISSDDYTRLPKDTPDYWYNVLEKTLHREVLEEAGVKIKNVRYVTSLADARKDDYPSLVISCLADYASGTVKTDDSMVAHQWVTLKEAKKVDLIEGIYEELAMADRLLKGKKTI